MLAGTRAVHGMSPPSTFVFSLCCAHTVFDLAYGCLTCVCALTGFGGIAQPSNRWRCVVIK